MFVGPSHVPSKKGRLVLPADIPFTKNEKRSPTQKASVTTKKASLAIVKVKLSLHEEPTSSKPKLCQPPSRMRGIADAWVDISSVLRAVASASFLNKYGLDFFLILFLL